MSAVTLMAYDTGLGELSRWIMAYGNITYIDHRVTKEEWPENKKESNDGDVFSGQLPVLIVNLDPIRHPLAQYRYLAQLAHLVPENLLAAAKCDSMVHDLYDLLNKINRNKCSHEDPEEEDSKTAYEELYKDVIEPLVITMNYHLSGKEWYISGKMSWTDLFIGQVFRDILKKSPEFLDSHAHVKSLVERVLEQPIIRECIDKEERV